jgi:hypothetical protein
MTEEDVRRAQEITNEIQIAGQEAQNSIEEAKAEAVATRRKDGYWWLIMVLTSLSFAAVSVLFSYTNTNASERKFCALMSTSLQQAQARVVAYDKEPPTTETGVAQRAQALVSLEQLRNLKQDLGCPPEN